MLSHRADKSMARDLWTSFHLKQNVVDFCHNSVKETWIKHVMLLGVKDDTKWRLLDLKACSILEAVLMCYFRETATEGEEEEWEVK